MNKLNYETIDFLKNLVQTCYVCGIDSVVVEQDKIRGQSEDSSRGIFLLETQTIPDFIPFETIGIGRVKTLRTRMSLLDDNIQVSYDTTERDNRDELVTKLILKNKHTKIDFSCTDPKMIRSPQKFNDPIYYGFDISEETLLVMSKAFAAINTKQISFSTGEDNNVEFRASDVEADMFVHIVSDEYTIDDNAGADNFYFSYSIKYVLPLFKAAMDMDRKLHVNISKRGIMKIRVNGFSVFVLPEL